jgi:hypothetical protein
MKSIRYSVVAAAMLLGSFVTVKGQSADEIIQKHITAIGGADNWKKVKSVKMSGSMNAQGTELPVTVTIMPGKAERVDFTMNGMANYQILTTKEGWSYFPIGGQQKPEAMTAEDVKESQDELDLQPLVDYKAKGCTATFLGKDDFEGTECYKLKVTYKSGKEETMFFDASNYYHIRSVAKMKANGQEMEQVSTYSNFQKLPEGIVFPMSMDQGQGQMQVKTVEINKPVDESIFKPASTTTK